MTLDSKDVYSLYNYICCESGPDHEWAINLLGEVCCVWDKDLPFLPSLAGKIKKLSVDNFLFKRKTFSFTGEFTVKAGENGIELFLKGVDQNNRTSYMKVYLDVEFFI